MVQESLVDGMTKFSSQALQDLLVHTCAAGATKLFMLNETSSALLVFLRYGNFWLRVWPFNNISPIDIPLTYT